MNAEFNALMIVEETIRRMKRHVPAIEAALRVVEAAQNLVNIQSKVGEEDAWVVLTARLEEFDEVLEEDVVLFGTGVNPPAAAGEIRAGGRSCSTTSPESGRACGRGSSIRPIRLSRPPRRTGSKGPIRLP